MFDYAWQLSGIDGKKNATNISYDALSRVTGVSNPLTSGTVSYNYLDPSKGTTQLSSVVFPNGKISSFSYYPNTGDRRLQEIVNFANDGTTVLSKFDYTYNPVGQIKQWIQQADANTPMAYNIGYDNANQLTSAVLNNTLNGTVSKQYYYGYDKSGNLTSEQINMGVNQSSYNAANQLMGMSGSSGPIHFQGMLNEPGTVNVNGSAATMTSGTSFIANPVLSSGTNMVSISATDGSGNTRTKTYKIVVPQGSGRTLYYDGNGNLANNGTGQTYEWDAANRLVGINYPTVSGTSRSEFTYDALGKRSKIVEKDCTGNTISTKQFIWCPGETQPSEERDATNTVTKRFYAQGEQISGKNYFYTRDHLGSVREMTDSNGNIRARYDYDPYGRLTKVSGDLDSDFSYDGYYNHNVSGLYSTTFRFYSADLGRWISRDPIGEDGGLNLYGYVGNNPLGLTDPLGLNPALAVPVGLSIGEALAGTAIAIAIANQIGDVIGNAMSEKGKPRNSVPISKQCSGASSSSPGAPDPDDNEDNKVKRISNPKHHPNSESPEPDNVDELYNKSIADENGVRWAKDEEGVIHRFTKPSNGESHWNGSTGGSDPIKPQNLPSRSILKQL